MAAGVATGEGAFRLDRFVLTLIGALAIQVAANFANDASDAARGADTADRVGPARMVAAGVISAPAMWRATFAATTVAAICAVFLTVAVGPVILIIGVVSVLAMLGYVGGPAPYGYRGLGEVAVFVFFGLVATAGGRYAYDGTVSRAAWVLAIPVGLMAAAILIVNNLRDIDTDRRVGKRTLAVIIGERATRRLYAATVMFALAVVAVAAVIGATPRATGVTVGWGVAAALPLRQVLAGSTTAALNAVLKATARLHLAIGITLAITTI